MAKDLSQMRASNSLYAISRRRMSTQHEAEKTEKWPEAFQNKLDEVQNDSVERKNIVRKLGVRLFQSIFYVIPPVFYYVLCTILRQEPAKEKACSYIGLYAISFVVYGASLCAVIFYHLEFVLTPNIGFIEAHYPLITTTYFLFLVLVAYDFNKESEEITRKDIVKDAKTDILLWIKTDAHKLDKVYYESSVDDSKQKIAGRFDEIVLQANQKKIQKRKWGRKLLLWPAIMSIAIAVLPLIFRAARYEPLFGTGPFEIYLAIYYIISSFLISILIILVVKFQTHKIIATEHVVTSIKQLTSKNKDKSREWLDLCKIRTRDKKVQPVPGGSLNIRAWLFLRDALLTYAHYTHLDNEFKIVTTTMIMTLVILSILVIVYVAILGQVVVSASSGLILLWIISLACWSLECMYYVQLTNEGLENHARALEADRVHLAKDIAYSLTEKGRTTQTSAQTALCTTILTQTHGDIELKVVEEGTPMTSGTVTGAPESLDEFVARSVAFNAHMQFLTAVIDKIEGEYKIWKYYRVTMGTMVITKSIWYKVLGSVATAVFSIVISILANRLKAQTISA